MARAVLPRVHVLVICDDIEERWEGDTVHDLLGVRTEMTVPMVPHICPQLCVYAQVTGHEGTSMCWVIIIRATDDEEIIARPEEEVHFTGPTEFIPLRFWIADCEFPEAGVYYIQFFFDGRLCYERAVEVIESGGDDDG